MTREEILKRLRSLPKGGLTTKTIKASNGNLYEYNFLQWYEDGKQKSRRIKPEEIESTILQLKERRELELKLSFADVDVEKLNFNTQVLSEEDLRDFVLPIKGYKKRNGFESLSSYIYGKEFERVFILYGLRRTGKTTLIKQVISEMNHGDFDKTAYIKISKNDTLASLNKDLRLLKNNNYKFIFIDEVTLLPDFIEGASLFSDVYVSMGMKIVLSGTDSLGFWITRSNELYDRAIFLHTTFISYKEFTNVLGIKGIDNYIQYGGTFSKSGEDYNRFTFSNKEETNVYVNSSIAHNIQNSLKYYQYGNHFRHLYSLYEKDELTGAINRVVEDMNHRFTIDVLERKFYSNDLKISSSNLRKDRFSPTTILDDIDVVSFTEHLKALLEIKDKEERVVEVDEEHVREIKEYLEALDLINEIDINYIGDVPKQEKRIVFTQPGLRYSQAESFIESINLDEVFNDLSIDEKKRIVERILSEIKGRMTEDVILLETKLAKPNNMVFKLEFPDGEFDMVIVDKEKLEVEIYKVKYSKEVVLEQTKHLLDEKKCLDTERRYGKIVKKGVLYRGETIKKDDIDYVNIEEYLNNL